MSFKTIYRIFNLIIVKILLGGKNKKQVVKNQKRRFFTMKQIKELSKELKVSKTTIWNYLQDLPQNLSITKEKNVYKIDKDVENFIREKLFKKSSRDLVGKEKEANDLNIEKDLLMKRIEEIKKDNEYLKKEVCKKDNFIEDLMTILKEQQKYQLDINKELLISKKTTD